MNEHLYIFLKKYVINHKIDICVCFHCNIYIKINFIVTYIQIHVIKNIYTITVLRCMLNYIFFMDIQKNIKMTIIM